MAVNLLDASESNLLPVKTVPGGALTPFSFPRWPPARWAPNRDRPASTGSPELPALSGEQPARAGQDPSMRTRVPSGVRGCLQR